jgi:hypothetical protein
MGCSSCQQNNHVVPTNTTHTHATPLCECACGCSEPVCPTPQPCTEITDSKCIIYTDAAIKCGNTTIVTTNASVSTALNQIVSYFCNLTTPTVTEDVLCGQDIIVAAGSTLEEAVIAIVDWVCSLNKDLIDVQDTITAITQQIATLTLCCDENTNTNLTQDEQIAALQVCCDENTETNVFQNTQITNIQNQLGNIVPHYKFVHEETTVFDGDTITILRQSLEYCNLLPPACTTDPEFLDKVCDLQISVYYLFNGSWIKIPERPFGSPAAQGVDILIDSTTGDISIILSIAPIDPAVPVRVVILA